jgi:hypothetical protein
MSSFIYNEFQLKGVNFRASMAYFNERKYVLIKKMALFETGF